MEYKPYHIRGILVEHIAEAMLAYEDFRVGMLTLEWLRYELPFAEVPEPISTDPRVRAVTAAVVEVLAEQAGQTPPSWTADIGGLDEPFFPWKLTPNQSFTRWLCETQSPEPFRKRNIFTTPNYLSQA